LSPEERLAALVASLESVGVSCLVMGGHKVFCQNRDRADKEAIRAAQRDGAR
jgi:hypothetical protein